MNQIFRKLQVSEHFELYQIAEGVYAAIGLIGGAAYSNAGIIDLGDRALIFDTFETPTAADDLRAAAEQLVGNQFSYIIISHAHTDHWMGNQSFPESVAIITTQVIRDEMYEYGAEMRELQQNPSEFEEEIREYEERLQAETDEGQRASLQATISRYRYSLEMLPDLKLRFPNQTFDGKLVFHGSQRAVELVASGKGHTASDCFLVLPAEKVAFIGDLGFFQCQPYMVYCDPDAWVAQLEAMEAWDIETFVPGHGPVGSKVDLALQKEYIRTLDQLVARVIGEGGTVEDALRQPLPAPFDAWLPAGRVRFEANMRSSYKRLFGG